MRGINILRAGVRVCFHILEIMTALLAGGVRTKTFS